MHQKTRDESVRILSEIIKETDEKVDAAEEDRRLLRSHWRRSHPGAIPPAWAEGMSRAHSAIRKAGFSFQELSLGFQQLGAAFRLVPFPDQEERREIRLRAYRRAYGAGRFTRAGYWRAKIRPMDRAVIVILFAMVAVFSVLFVIQWRSLGL